MRIQQHRLLLTPDLEQPITGQQEVDVGASAGAHHGIAAKAEEPHSIEALADLLQQQGVVGLGGGAYPSGLKLLAARSASCLLVNAVECEPGASSDLLLATHRAALVVAGCTQICRLLPIRQLVIAVPARKSPIAQRLAEAMQRENAATIPDVSVRWLECGQDYPAGSESQLLDRLLTRQQRSTRDYRPASHFDVLCLNLSTLVAIAEASKGTPMTDRVVTCLDTITGQCVNARVAIGLPVSTMLAALGMTRKDCGVQPRGQHRRGSCCGRFPRVCARHRSGRHHLMRDPTAGASAARVYLV